MSDTEQEQVRARVRERLERIFANVEAIRASKEYDRNRPPLPGKGDHRACPRS
jgi:hypothetical protein